MRLSEFIRRPLVRCPLRARTKTEALEELSAVVTESCGSVNQRDIIAAIEARERQGPLSMGKQIAFPHARTDSIKDFTIAIGTCPQGIDFRAPDGLSIKLVVLFVIPKRHSNLYLEVLASFLNFFSVEQNFNNAVQAGNVDEFMMVFDVNSKAPTERLIRFDFPRLSTSSTVRDVLTIMSRSNSNSIPIVDDKGSFEFELRLEGKLHDPDFVRNNANRPISELGYPRSTQNCIQFPPKKEELHKLFSTGAQSVYVLKEGQLYGVISAIDFLASESI
jgi:PTS system fructose-specific IIA component/PTS system nitrogen regulatory IIA component